MTLITSPPTTLQPALANLIAAVAWRAEALAGAAEDIRVALDGVNDTEIEDPNVATEVADAVGAVWTALDDGLAEIVWAIERLDALTATVTDDED